jgi:hypothetical protein
MLGLINAGRSVHAVRDAMGSRRAATMLPVSAPRSIPAPFPISVDAAPFYIGDVGLIQSFPFCASSTVMERSTPTSGRSATPADINRNGRPTSIGMPGRHHRNAQTTRIEAEIP